MDSSSSHRTINFASESEIRRRLHRTWKEIEDVKEQIRATTEVIAKANASLIKLRMVEKELHGTAAATASLITPSMFQYIPLDIIGEIIGHLLAPPNEPFNASWNHSGLWPLTHVCQSWRTGILSLPWLWSSFSVTTDSSSLQRISTVLQRSADYPLSLELHLNSESSSYPVIALLTKHSRRWKNMKLSGTTGPTPLLPLRGQLPQLERLEVSLRERSTGGDGQVDPWRDSNEEQSIFEDAPKMIELHLEDAPFTDRGLRVNLRFPLRQMQKVGHLPSPDLRPLFTLDNLSNLSNVTDLHLGVAYVASFTTNTRTVTLPRVTSLRLAVEAISLLTALWLPSLTSLGFDDMAFKDETLIITAFLTEHCTSFSNWGLSTLTVGNSIPGPRFIDLLGHAALKNLHTLSCKYVSLEYRAEWDQMANIIALLIWTPPPPWIPNLSAVLVSETHLINIMPHLRNLTLRFSSEWFRYCTFDLVRELAVSRMHLNDAVYEDPEVTWLRTRDTDVVDQVGGAALESTPAQLQSFSIGYMDSIPDITMKDLSMVVQGKFDVLVARESI